MKTAVADILAGQAAGQAEAFGIDGVLHVVFVSRLAGGREGEPEARVVFAQIAVRLRIPVVPPVPGQIRMPVGGSGRGAGGHGAAATGLPARRQAIPKQGGQTETGSQLQQEKENCLDSHGFSLPVPAART